MMANGDLRARLFAAHHALVGRSVRVHLVHDKTFVCGVLYAIDPESGDVALLSPTAMQNDENGTHPSGATVKIVLGHAIDTLTLDESAPHLTIESIQSDVLNNTTLPPQTQATASVGIDAGELMERLKSYLDQCFIPHAAGADATTVAVFGGAATLRFPFDSSDVECVNEQILRRLQSLLVAFHAAQSKR